MDLYQASAATYLSSNQAILKDAVLPGSGHCVTSTVEGSCIVAPHFSHYTIYIYILLPFAY